MQVEMTVSNRFGKRARSMRAPLSRLSLGMMLMLVFALPEAQAQRSDDVGVAKPPSSETAAAPTEQTRVRRAVETSNATDNKAVSDETNAVEAAGDVSVELGNDRLSALRTQIEAAKSDNERSRLQRMLIDYLVALGKKSDAVTELRVMLREDRLDPIGFYNIGNALARLGDTDTAIDAYRKAIKQRHGNYARALNNLGVMLLRQGRWDEAQSEFASALRLENLRYAEASYNLGRVYSARGEADLAIREWTRALNTQPDHADAAIALARAYAEDGNPERGLAVLDNFVAHRGASAELAEARREILFGSEESKAGVTLNTNAALSTKAATTSVPVTEAREGNSSRATLNAGSDKERTLKSVDSKRAAASLRTLTVDRETYDLLEKARAAREGGRDEEAITFYRRVLSRSNGLFPPANLELAFALSSLKRYDEAAEALLTVAKREGARYPIVYYHLGRQYEQLGRLGLAAEAFEQAAAAYGDKSPQFLLDLSRVREKEGNFQAALAAMESYVRINQGLGHTLEWSNQRLAALRQKASKK
jgi:tetratricopeptide (TPR) repeat protein